MSDTTHIVLKTAKAIAGELGHKMPSTKHKKAACEAILAIADALKDIGESSDEDIGIDLSAISGFLVEVALEASPPPSPKELRQFMAELDEMTGLLIATEN